MFVSLILRLQNLMRSLHLWIELATSQMFHSQMGLVATTLDIVVIDEYFPIGF